MLSMVKIPFNVLVIKWIHLNCMNITLEQFYEIIEDNNLCPKCTFPFYDITNIDLLNNINTTDNMALFNLMPELSISSNVDKVHNLLNYYIDENLTDNINCKYYTRDICNLVKFHKAFNIFHANIDGLESHFQDLHVLPANMKSEFSAICINKTSQNPMKISRLMYPYMDLRNQLLQGPCPPKEW